MEVGSEMLGYSDFLGDTVGLMRRAPENSFLEGKFGDIQLQPEAPLRGQPNE